MPAVACGSHSEAGAVTEPPVAPLDAGALIVGLGDVQRITNFDDLSADARFDRHEPGDVGAAAPEPCRVVYDQRATFSGNLTQFRSVLYSGASNMSVTQAIGVYPSAHDARAAFERIEDALAKCAGLHADGYGYTARRVDPATVRVCFAADCRAAFGVRSTVLIGLNVQHFPRTSEQIGADVMQAIADRIKVT